MDIVPHETPKGNILIVDDAPDNLHLLSTTLTEHGYEVRGVINGAMALRVARSAPPDLILLDIKMPDLSGYEVCRQLKECPTTQEIPVIFLSALDEVLDKVRAFSSGGVDYITKPFQVAEVLARVETHLNLQTAKAEIRHLNAELEQRVQQRTEEIHQKNQALQASEARFRLIAENMSDLVCLQSVDGRYLYLSPSCQSVLGFQPDELLNTSIYDLIHPEDLQHGRLTISADLQPGAPPLVYRIRRKSNDYIWLETIAQAVRDSEGRTIQFVTTSRDVTARVLAEERLTYTALHDALTALPNRVLFMERVELAVRRLKRHEGYAFAVLFIDLDRFKLVNDSLGHAIGDALLVAIARLLESLVRDVDTVARLGGDEFTLLLDEIDDFTDALKVAQRILECLQTPLQVEGHTVFTTASIGIVFSSAEYQHGSELLRDADLAMYRAKGAGRSRYEIFDKAMHAEVLHLLKLENDLRQGLQKQEFLLYYQPIVELTSGQLRGFEALVRWNQPDRGLVSPNQFIPVAEDSGLIVPLGAWILRQACQQMRTWQASFPCAADLFMSVNLASQQIREPGFLNYLDQVLAQTHLAPHSLKLEITESTLLEGTEQIMMTLTHIRDRHIQLSIDDFGTGYSSLSYLHRFPINTLKVDRSFINQIQNSADRLGIVKAIVMLAQTLGMDVVAEGIETSEQFNYLRLLQCELGQGYFFAPPLEAVAATHLLQSLRPFNLN